MKVIISMSLNKHYHELIRRDIFGFVLSIINPYMASCKQIYFPELRTDSSH